MSGKKKYKNFYTKKSLNSTSLPEEKIFEFLFDNRVKEEDYNENVILTKTIAENIGFSEQKVRRYLSLIQNKYYPSEDATSTVYVERSSGGSIMIEYSSVVDGSSEKSSFENDKIFKNEFESAVRDIADYDGLSKTGVKVITDTVVYFKLKNNSRPYIIRRLKKLYEQEVHDIVPCYKGIYIIINQGNGKTDAVRENILKLHREVAGV